MPFYKALGERYPGVREIRALRNEAARGLDHGVPELEGWVPPLPAAQFVAAYLKGRRASQFLDPFAGLGLFPLLLCRYGAVVDGTALIPGAVAQLASQLDPASRAHFESAVFTSSSYAQEGEHDLIASLSLFTRATSCVNPEETLGVRNKGARIGRQEWRPEDEALLDTVLARVAERGEVVLLLSESFFNAFDYRHIWRENGGTFSLDTVVCLSEELRSAGDTQDFCLAMFTRRRKDGLFVARLDPRTDVELLASNVRARADQKVLPLGRLVEHREFHAPWRVYESRDYVRSRAKRAGLEAVSLTKVAKSWSVLTSGGTLSEARERQQAQAEARRSLKEAGEARGSLEMDWDVNTVFVPWGDRQDEPATADYSEVADEPGPWLTVELDEEMALAEYVAGFLNSPLGLRLRERFFTTISSDEAETALYIPPVGVQKKVIAVDAQMRKLAVQLHELEERLWSAPRAANAVAEDIRDINDSDPIGTWMESLPFPLASVLWRYRATNDSSEKIESLLDFFEALSEFVACLLLSALRNDPQDYAQLLPTWLGERADPARGSFGQWVHLGRAMSKHVKRCLSGSHADREKMLGLFRVHRVDRLDGICGGRLFSLLEQVATFRNDDATEASSA